MKPYAVPVRAECHRDTSTEFHFLEHSSVIPQAPQTLPERAAEQPETGTIPVARSEALILTVAEEQSQRQQTQSQLTSKLCCRGYVSIRRLIFPCLGAKSALI